MKNAIKFTEEDLLTLCNMHLLNFIGHSKGSQRLIKKVLSHNNVSEFKTLSFEKYLSNFHTSLYQRWIHIIGRSADSFTRSEARDEILQKVKENQDAILSKIRDLN